jgi:hypothetical protein
MVISFVKLNAPWRIKGTVLASLGCLGSGMVGKASVRICIAGLKIRLKIILHCLTGL